MANPRYVAKHAILSPVWRNHQRALAIKVLDQYCGNINEKIQRYLNGDRDIDTCNDEACFNRLLKDHWNKEHLDKDPSYDKFSHQLWCPDCDIDHKIHAHRGYFMACIIGLWGEFDNDNEQWIRTLFEPSASHRCHNPPCSDPFRHWPDPIDININQNTCHNLKGNEVCGNCPHCLLNRGPERGNRAFQEKRLEECNSMKKVANRLPGFYYTRNRERNHSEMLSGPMSEHRPAILVQRE